MGGKWWREMREMRGYMIKIDEWVRVDIEAYKKRAQKIELGCGYS
jgi:hypothetical protein